MRRAISRSFSLLGLLLCLALPAAAQDAEAPSAAPKRLRSGPVTVTADRAEWRREGIMRYSGKVLLKAQDFELDGQDMELQQIRDGRYRASIQGTPARLRQQASKDLAQPALVAEADRIVYDSGTGEVEMIGHVTLKRGTDELRGQRIQYDIAQRRIQADGGDGGQVHITIQPPDSDPAP